MKIGENIGQSFVTPCYSAPFNLSVETHSNVSVDMELKRPRLSYDANYCVSFTLSKYPKLCFSYTLRYIDVQLSSRLDIQLWFTAFARKLIISPTID